MVMKDIRTFLRDPMQWSQALIFFGLLGLYFASMRSFRYDRLPDEWRNTIVFLNIFSVASVVCSLAARFVYPQLSLEGQAFWMLGLAPTSARRVLLTKYLLAVALMTGVSAGLMGLAVSMLRVEPLLRVVATAIAAAIAVAACGLSTGLGAVFLNLKQSNTLAIVSGFGGTLNLVLSLGFMLGALLPSGLMFHWRAAGHIGPAQFREGLVLAMVWLAAATVLATVVPLWLGIRSLTQREY
jgi:ABC-2 type transport system permease protein